MKRWKVTIYLFVVLGLLGSGGAYALRVKSTTPSQVGMSEKIDGKKQSNDPKNPPKKVNETSMKTGVATSGNGARTNPATSNVGTTPTNVTHGSWFMIPGEIRWNNVKYMLDLKRRITSIGKEIGMGQDSMPFDYPIFEIPGIDPSQEVAVDVHQVYFEAFPQK